MHPNTYLRTLWRSETKDQVFVAMSFEPRFVVRFDEIIKPAVEDKPIAGRRLCAYRVDNSLTGDSILTDIADGVAHSAIFLADVSVIDEGRYAEQPIRNGNVMYEVGLALACRLPSEVLLIRDDRKRFLFDVSTIPHVTIDFSDRDAAIDRVRAALTDRLKETATLLDARVTIALRGLTPLELQILESLTLLGPEQARDFSKNSTGHLSIPAERAVSALLMKGCIQSVAINAETNGIFYGLTPFGANVARAAKSRLRKVRPTPVEAEGEGDALSNKPLNADASEAGAG